MAYLLAVKRASRGVGCIDGPEVGFRDVEPANRRNVILASFGLLRLPGVHGE